MAGYLAHDASAARMLFAVYTSERQKPAQPKPHAATIAARTCALAERGMSIRDGLLSEARPFHSTTAIPETTSRNGAGPGQHQAPGGATKARASARKESFILPSPSTSISLFSPKREGLPCRVSDAGS